MRSVEINLKNLQDEYDSLAERYNRLVANGKAAAEVQAAIKYELVWKEWKEGVTQAQEVLKRQVRMAEEVWKQTLKLSLSLKIKRQIGLTEKRKFKLLKKRNALDAPLKKEYLICLKFVASIIEEIEKYDKKIKEWSVGVAQRESAHSSKCEAVGSNTIPSS